MKYRIEKNCTSQREYEVNEKEEVFFDRLYDSVPEGDRLFIHLYRMSNGKLSVYYKTYPIGKIKLHGRVFSMQILKGLSSVKNVDGSLAVSYTHLDVYKRQHLEIPAKQCGSWNQNSEETKK